MMIRIITSISIFLLCSISIAQTNYIALITDPQIGPDANAEKLIEVVDDINKRDSISYVVVMGNLTANGKFDEFLWVQEILDGLIAPYNVIGGKKDYTLSEGKGNEISLLWGDDKFWFEKENEIHTGFNVLIPKYKHPNKIEKETKDFLWELTSDKVNPVTFIYTYNHTDLEKVSQSFMIAVKPIYIVGSKNFKDKNKFTFTGHSLSKAKEWKYELLEIKKDSILIGEISQSFETSIINEKIVKKAIPLKIPVLIDPFTFYSEKISPRYLKIGDATIFDSPAIDNEKIFWGYKHGLISCMNLQGELAWQYETNGTIYSSPKVEKDLVVVATNEGDLFTINKNTGNLYQVIGIGETITSDIALVDIEHNDMKTKGICFGTAEGNFYCYELYSLELIWWNNGVKEMINSSVATVKGKVIFQDKKGTMYCLNSQSGVLLWKWKAKTKVFDPLFKSDLIVSNNNVYFIDFDGDLHCIDALLGTKKWSIRKIKATGKIELNEQKNQLILHSAKNKILVVSPAKRKVTEDLTLPGKTKDEMATSIELIGNKLIIGFTNGNVYQLEKKQIPKRILWQGNAPIVSLNKINGNILVTDYDGNLSLIELLKEKK